MPPLPLDSGTKAIENFRKLVAEDPADPFARDDLIWALWRTAEYDDPAVGLGLTDEAIKIGEHLVEEYPASAGFRRDLANALNVRGYLIANPSPDSARKALPFVLRSLGLKAAALADLEANRPEAFQPQRPRDSEADMLRPASCGGRMMLRSVRITPLACIKCWGIGVMPPRWMTKPQPSSKNWSNTTHLSRRSMKIL